MDYVVSLLDSDRWLSVIEHGEAVVISIVTAVLTATVVWIVLRIRYQGTIAKQRRKLEEFGDKLHGATPDEAQRRIESLQARLDRLEPRRLTGRQKTVLKRLLPLPETAGITAINVAHDAACGDGKQYAEDFARLLRSSHGWQPSSATMFGSSQRTGSGIAIVCCGRGRTAAAAKVLSNALAEAGIVHETIQSEEEELELVISTRLSMP